VADELEMIMVNLNDGNLRSATADTMLHQGGRARDGAHGGEVIEVARPLSGDTLLRTASPDPVRSSSSQEARRSSGTAVTDETLLQRDSLGGEVVELRPASDTLGRAQVRAALASSMFGAKAEPVRLGRFVIMGRLGEGGMGVVYSAYDPQLDRRVALKLLRSSREPGRPRARARLLREAKALAQLSHPNVVPVHDVGVLKIAIDA
jgi:hypothetical protein